MAGAGRLSAIAEADPMSQEKSRPSSKSVNCFFAFFAAMFLLACVGGLLAIWNRISDFENPNLDESNTPSS
ncbi:MAG: hypothetical protein J6M57_02570, partial [Acidaminococcaceae bacterium]|nr:hypothetical protein [Acidaminococcaceae bacterium]